MKLKYTINNAVMNFIYFHKQFWNSIFSVFLVFAFPFEISDFFCEPFMLQNNHKPIEIKEETNLFCLGCAFLFIGLHLVMGLWGTYLIFLLVVFLPEGWWFLSSYLIVEGGGCFECLRVSFYFYLLCHCSILLKSNKFNVFYQSAIITIYIL